MTENPHLKLADEAAARIAKNDRTLGEGSSRLLQRLEQAVRELVRESKDWHALMSKLVDERDEARAEAAIARERLGPAGWKLLLELKDKRAEVQRLQDTISKMNDDWMDDARKSRAEVERLKTRLKDPSEYEDAEWHAALEQQEEDAMTAILAGKELDRLRLELDTIKKSKP